MFLGQALYVVYVIGLFMLALASPATACEVTAPPPGESANSRIEACFKDGAVQLNDGIYNLTQSLVLPSHTTLTGKPGHRDAVVLVRAAAQMGPLVVMGALPGANPSNLEDAATGVHVENLTLDGGKAAPQVSAPFNNVNIWIDGCTDCQVYRVNSENARLCSIAVNSGRNIVVADNYVHDNGEPRDQPFRRSDGIAVQAISGISRIEHNWLANNTDVQINIGGGSTGQLFVTDNTIAPITLSLTDADTPGVAGVGLMFNTEPNWGPHCGKAGYLDCGDFSAVVVAGNVENCGAGCMYGVAVGTHLNNNWNDKDANGLPRPNLPARNIVIGPDNRFERLTIDYTAAASSVRPTVNSCKFSSLCAAGTFDSARCIPCRGLFYQQYPDAFPGAAADGTMCDWQGDAR